MLKCSDFFFLTEPAVIAKSSVILDVKPWDDETDMQEMEKLVRTIKKDGLVWGACKSTIDNEYKEN